MHIIGKQNDLKDFLFLNPQFGCNPREQGYDGINRWVKSQCCHFLSKQYHWKEDNRWMQCFDAIAISDDHYIIIDQKKARANAIWRIGAGSKTRIYGATYHIIQGSKLAESIFIELIKPYDTLDPENWV